MFLACVHPSIGGGCAGVGTGSGGELGPVRARSILADPAGDVGLFAGP